jgi:hypothetical protein
MKKIIKLTIAYIILGNYNAQAQCWENINTATTDWRKNNSANTWNWTQENFDVYLTNQTGATQVKSPFWVTQGASTNNNPHLWDFRKYITADKKDFHPEDGWELVTKQFGILSNNESEKETNPFFALYNKYTGKLRCFLLIVNGENNFNTGAMLHIEFERGVRKTGLFQHMKPIAKEVLNFDPLINSQNPNFIINTNYYWLFSETVVAYDPCTCFEYPSTIGNTDSKVIFQYFLIQESDINAKINGTFKEKVTESKQSSSGNPSVSTSNLKTVDGIKGLVKAGQKGYKEYSKYKSDINKTLKQYTDSANRGRIWKDLQNLRSKNESLYDDLVTKLIPNPNEELSRDKFIKGEYVMNADEFYTIDDASFLLGLLDAAKPVIKTLPYIGAAIGAIDFLVTSTKDKEKSPELSVAPTIFEVDLTLEGTLETTASNALHQIYTPGSYTGANNFKPIYNNILGVFNILELPDFEFSLIKPNIFNITSYALNVGLENNCQKNKSNFNMTIPNNVVFKQYRPKSPLKYVVNPASDFEVVNIEAAIVTRFKGEDNLYLESPNDFNSTLAIPFHDIINTTSKDDKLYYKWYKGFGYFPEPIVTNGIGSFVNKGGKLSDMAGVEPDINLSLIQFGDLLNKSATVERIKSIENNTNLTLDFVSPNFPFKDSSIIQFRTDYLPANCFENLSITLLGNNNFSEIFTKIYVVLKHKNNPNIKPITMILSYDLKGKLLSATNANIDGSYNCKIWGKDYETDNHPLWKCGNYTFISADIDNYMYHQKSKFEITSLPFNQNFFKPHNKNYNGEQNLTVIGNLHFPDNSVVPANSNIKSGGRITFGNNVNIGSNTKIESEIQIEMSNNMNIEPDVEFNIVDNNSVKYTCHIPNYQNSHMTNNEIAAFCNKNKYKEKAFSSSVRQLEDIDTNKESNLANNNNSFKLAPNPTTANFTISVINNNEQDYSIALMDVTGKVLLNNLYNGKQTSQFIETNGLAAGIYFVKITCGNTQKTEKLIIHNNQ